MKKLLALLLVAVMLVSAVACTGNPTPGPDTGTTPPDGGDKTPVDPLADYISLDDKVWGEDYTSLYEKFGKEVTIADVKENEDGHAYITVDEKDYVLGLDFLSMAMVYNVEVPADHAVYKTADDVYAGWWKYYITRWNYLLPEIPLYSNQYYDMYNTKITGVKENPTNPYWGPADALIDWNSTDGQIIIGNTTDLSGKFRYAAFGATSPGAADNDIAKLTIGLDTVTTNKEGGYCWNDTVVKAHSETLNEDGTKTFEIEIHNDLKFSDGSAITAKNYLITTLVFSTPVATQAAKKDHQSAMTVVGYDKFAAYDGTNDGATVGEGDKAITVSKALSGLRLLGDYKFSVTIAADYIPYFYDIGYASFAPTYQKLWLGDTADIKDDGNGAYITEDFFAKAASADDGYALAAHILASSTNTDTTYPYSGAYVVESYNVAEKQAVLKANPYFKGNYEGTKPAIEKIVYKRIVSNTQMEDLKAGGLDLIAGITGGDETNEALKVVSESNGKFDTVTYARAGYGKLGFRGDFGAVQFRAVRAAIALCMDRQTFAKDFTGGFGGVVDGPYYTGSWMYKAATAQGMLLDAYATSLDAAIDLLEEDGWVYNADGTAYDAAKGGVRYKQIPADKIKEDDKTFQSIDGAYKTVLIGDNYYMPLVLNWYGTTENPFTDLLVPGLETNANVKAAGFAVQKTIGEFNPMLEELYQAPVYGGNPSEFPLYELFNFATGFNSAVYDYSWNLTIDPSMYEDYSIYYVKDVADIFWLK